jgi:hypothetical protein
MGELQRVAIGKAHAVAGGKEHDGGIFASQQAAKPILRGCVGQTHLHLPIRLVPGDQVGQWFHQFRGAQPGGPASGVLHPKEGDAAGQGHLAGLRRHHAPGVPGVFLRSVKG